MDNRAKNQGAPGILNEVPKDEFKFKYKKASSVIPKAINWLWKGYLAIGKVTLFAGEQGTGKSTLLFNLASLISNGAKLKNDGSNIQKGNVIILSAEDDEADTILPRLIAAEANTDNIYIFERSLENIVKKEKKIAALDTDIDELANTLKEIGNVKLIIIDPITAYLGKINDFKRNEVCNLIYKLAEIAEENQCAIILNTHLNKQRGGLDPITAMNRVQGSGAYTSAVRLGFLISKNPEDSSQILIMAMKNNIAKESKTLGYKIVSKEINIDNFCIETSTLEWIDAEFNLTANEAVNPTLHKEKTNIEEAIEFLKRELKFGGKYFDDLQSKAAREGITISTLKRAKSALNVVSLEPNYGDKRRTRWDFPALNS